MLERLYAPFPDVPRLRTNTRTAEMIKYASNALLALLISFSNELANLGDALGGIDTVEVMRGVHAQPGDFRARRQGGPMGCRRSWRSCAAGCGFGGSCLPKDVSALIAHGRGAARCADVHDARRPRHQRPAAPEDESQLAHKHLPSLAGRRVTVLGVAFEPIRTTT